ncbi:MAG: hypothetical protein AAB546_01125 [Patescibacteria group bacterium]
MKLITKIKLIAVAGFILSFAIYLFTSAGNTPYDYFTRLSDSFVQGKYYLQEGPPWLSELIPAGPKKFYVVYPPMPAIAAIPFRLVFQQSFHQQYLAHLFGAGIVAITILISWTTKKDTKLAVWSGLLASVGTIMWFLSSVGSSWYLGQISAAFFMMIAIYESLNKKRPFVIGVFLGAAFLSRIHTIIAFPFFLYVLFGKDWFKKYFLLGLGVLPFILFNFYYNFIRFGTILDQAYFILPKLLGEENRPWFIHGVANPIYIPNNIKAMFWTFPKILDKFPFIQPSWAGLAIWITTPAFIYAFFAHLKDKINLLAWVSIFLVFLIVASHGGTGWAQFGYRFAVDFYPFLIFLTIKGVAKTGVKWHHWLFLFVSVLVNTWGVLWINKFGWVTF